MGKTINIIFAAAGLAFGLAAASKADSLGSKEENKRFVSQLYKNLLGRNASSAEQSALTDLASSSGRSSAVKYVQTSVERYSRLVNDFYHRTLRRDPAPGETTSWLNMLRKAGSMEQVKAGILGSNEFYGRLGNSSSWVQSLYKGLLGRSPSGNETKLPAGAIANANSRSQFVLTVLSSNESRANLIQGLYDGLLGRKANPAEVGFWLGSLSKGGGEESVRTAILSSDEFYTRAQRER